MNLVQAMTRGLSRGDASEFAVVTGRLPCVKVKGAYEPVGQPAPTDEDILEMLVMLGGIKYVDTLGPQPVTWRTQEDGIGSLVITAIRREGIVQARFVPQRSSASTKLAPPVAATANQVAPVAARPVSIELDIDPRTYAPSTPQKAPALPPIAIELAEAPASAAAVALATPSRRLEVTAPSPAPPHARSAEAPLASASTPALSPGTASAASPALVPYLAEARQHAATDLHIVATRPPLFRIAGELVPMGEPLDPQTVEAMLLATVPSRLRAMFDRDGSCDFAIAQPEHGRFRVNVSRQRTGMKASLRLIGRKMPTLETLGLPEAIGQATHHHQGLIVITGPTGHGKTSTLAAIVDMINPETPHHIITVEDPVEYVHPRKRAMLSASAKSGPTPARSRRARRPRCAKIPTSSWWASCATPKRCAWRSPRARPGTWSSAR